jgi:hypothetical protein
MPVRLVFFIVLLIFAAAKYIVYPEASERTIEISNLLLKITMFALSTIILFSLLTTLIPYILYVRSKGKPEVKFRYADDNNLICEIECRKFPFFFAGVLKARIVFDNRYTASILLERKKGRRMAGVKKLSPPDIKSYDPEAVTLFFQDYFRMFSMQKTFYFKASITVLPVHRHEHDIISQPIVLSDNEIRTDTIHRKEGELLHFKQFESSDDVRRIVWAFYAKSKELIVRTTEMYSMYVSKLDFHASFCNEYADLLKKNTDSEFLNYYKTAIWETYRSVKTTGKDIYFIPDQKSKSAAKHGHEVSAQISGMSWHSNRIYDYLKDAKVSICCISSLVPVQDIEKAANFTFSSETFVVFVTLKSFLGKINPLDILTLIFTVPEKKPGWLFFFSRNGKTILNNEKAIRDILKSRSINYLEL